MDDPKSKWKNVKISGNSKVEKVLKRSLDSIPSPSYPSNVCNMNHEPRIIPVGYIRSSRFDGPDMEF